MLNIIETLQLYKIYTFQRDLIIRFVSYSICLSMLVEIIRSEVAEINLLQLMPGVYLTLVFLLLLFCFIFGEWFFRFAFIRDRNKKIGGKVGYCSLCRIRFRFRYLLFFLGSAVAFENILPIGLDSFSNYGETTVQNLWNFNDLNIVETTLLYFITLIFQFPINLTNPFYSSKKIQSAPSYLRDYSFFICIVAGIITPTVDIPTQFAFVAIGISLYLLVLSITRKQIIFFLHKSICN